MTSELWLARIDAEVVRLNRRSDLLRIQRMTDSWTGGARAGTYRYLCEFDQLS